MISCKTPTINGCRVLNIFRSSEKSENYKVPFIQVFRNRKYSNMLIVAFKLRHMRIYSADIFYMCN